MGEGLRGLKPPLPFQEVNEMRNIHFGQNTSSCFKKFQENEHAKTPLHESVSSKWSGAYIVIHKRQAACYIMAKAAALCRSLRRRGGGGGTHRYTPPP